VRPLPQADRGRDLAAANAIAKGSKELHVGRAYRRGAASAMIALTT
jgi:hypothetical protein